MSSQSYQVPSATTPGRSYTVTVFTDTGDTRCDCPDATYRRRQCKHARYVLTVYTTAGRSGALIEAAQTDYAVAHERDLKSAEITGDTLATLIAERNAAETDRISVSKITRGW